MESVYKKYIFFDQGIVSAIINFSINFALGFVFFQSVSLIPLWGSSSIISDSIIMVFVLTSLTVLVITFVTNLKVKQKKLTALTWRRSSHPVLKLLPANIWWRSIIMGIIYLIILIPLIILALTLLKVQSMTFWNFVLFKASFAGINAFLVGPLSAFSALGDA